MPTSTLAEGAKNRKLNDELEVGDAAKMAATAATATAPSPYNSFFDKMEVFMKERGYIGSLLIKGIPQEDDDDEYEEEKYDTDKYTEDQMNSVRHIMITQNRADKLDEMENLILGDQADSEILCFSTSFSYDVFDSLDTLRSLLRKSKTPAQKFDLLLAYTYTVQEHDTWMHDNEGDMEEYTKGLASLWKNLLKKADKDLEIDAEYTKPALEEFLKQFQKEVEMHRPMKFRYK